MSEKYDLQRLRQEYAQREIRFSGINIYSMFNPAGLFAIQQRERVLLKVLRHHGFDDLHKCNILEIGCGSGGVLVEFLSYGADPSKIHGIDLLFPRLLEAHKKLASSQIISADGQRLPYQNSFFDLILQFTAFSSILDDQIKKKMAADMLRVLKPQGAILWYDFWLNPINKQTRGIRPAEIRRLFPNCLIEFHKITLAPPLARRIVSVSWGLAFVLESLKLFNTHYLVLIRKPLQ